MGGEGVIWTRRDGIGHHLPRFKNSNKPFLHEYEYMMDSPSYSSPLSFLSSQAAECVYPKP